MSLFLFGCKFMLANLLIYSAEVAKIIQKAFKLGLVGKNEELIAKYEQSI